MLAPSADEKAAAKAECQKRFGHQRVCQIVITPPIETTALMAGMNLREAAVYHDAWYRGAEMARAALIAERCLFPTGEQLDVIRHERRLPAVDALIELQFRKMMGWNAEPTHAQPLSASTAPPSFAQGATGPALLQKVADLQAVHKDKILWVAHQPLNGLELIMAAPTADVWNAASMAAMNARETNTNRLTAVLDFARDHIVWSPKPIDVHLDERPGRASDIASPFFEMGGSAAQASGSFL